MAEPTVTIEIPRDHAEALQRQKERRDREPLLFCKLITRWPVKSFLIALSGHLLVVIISVSLLAGGYDLLPVDFENLPLEINDEPWRPRDLAWTHRDTFSTYYDRNPTVGYRSKSYFRADLDMYFDADGGNIFTKENLQLIQNIENTITSIPEYNSYCQLNSNLSACAMPTSVIRFFDGSLSSISAVFNDPSFNNIPAVLYEAYTNNDTAALFQFFLGKTHSITITSAYSPITRTRIPIGFPVQGYTDTDKFEDYAQSFSVTYLKPVLEDFRNDIGAFDFSYYSYLMWADFVFGQAMKDVLCAVGSICFIFVFILIHTKSLFITGFAIFSILSSFLCTNLIYRIVLDYRYIGFFHVLTIFIILGIGADDIFVFYDVWRNTAFEEYKTLAHRLSDAYRKSVFSMLFTSITTAVAFFASAISPLLATESFGVFSGLVIVVNYISVIVYFPTVVVIYHTKFEKFRWPCILYCKKNICHKCCPPNSQHIDDDGQIGQDDHTSKADQAGQSTSPSKKIKAVPIHNNFTQNGHIPNGLSGKKPLPNGTVDRKSHSTLDPSNFGSADGVIRAVYEVDAEDKTSYIISPKEPNTFYGQIKPATNSYINKAFIGDPDEKSNGHIPNNTVTGQKYEPPYYGTAKRRKRKSMMVHFFKTKFFRFVTHKYIRWIILVVMAGVLIFFAVQASKLEPDNEPLQVLKDSHVFSIAAKHQTSSFVSSSSDRTTDVHIVWGMQPNDLSGCHFSTPKCSGTRVWDSNFNPNTPAAQLAMTDFCNTLMSLSAEEAYNLRIRTDFTTGKYEINCFILNLGTFLDADTTASANWSLTYDYNKTFSFMSERPTFYNASLFNSSFQDYLEIPISNWLSNNYTYDRTNDFYMFDHLIGEEISTFTQPLKNDPAKKYGNKIKYIGIQVNTTMRLQTLGFPEGIPVMNRWEDLVNAQNKKMPAGVNNAYQTTYILWHWLLVQEMLAKNAIYGIAIGVCLAFPILTIATGNIITGALATFAMCCSTVSVIGVIPLGGWKLGVLVSLNMCMVVGLTVDYVVHLAEGYTLSLHHDRLNRVRDMLDEMGVSVFFGACTTLGASMFMFLAQLSFFLQFGIFMFCTIGFSLFFSMGMFVTLMGLVGPQNKTGNIIHMCKQLRQWCNNKRAKMSTEVAVNTGNDKRNEDYVVVTASNNGTDSAANGGLIDSGRQIPSDHL